MIVSRGADPDTDPAFHLNADPDHPNSALLFYADPDPASFQSERPRLSTALF
jgi:hypothetical protein